MRGTGADQNLSEGELVKIAQERYGAMPGGDRYDKKCEDMERLTGIYQKQFVWDKQTGEYVPRKEPRELTEEDLRFIYQMDDYIDGFGYDDDPRVGILRQGRDLRSDLARAIGCRPDQVSFDIDKAFRGEGTLFHCVNLDFRNLISAEGLKLPGRICGNLNLEHLTSIEGLKLPGRVNGNLCLDSLTSAKGLQLPGIITGALYLNSLTSAEGLYLPETVHGDLCLNSLTSAEDLRLPVTVGDLYLNSLTSAEDLRLSVTVGDLCLNSLTSAEGLQFPDLFSGSLWLKGLTSVEGLQLPEHIRENPGLSALEPYAHTEDVRGLICFNKLIAGEVMKQQWFEQFKDWILFR